MPTTEQTIIKVGSEGGCIELLGIQAGGAWLFRLATDDTTLINHLDETTYTGTAGPWVSTLEAALTQLDEYPWQQLHPLAVHPEFHKQVANALCCRGIDPKSFEWSEWCRLMFGEANQ